MSGYPVSEVWSAGHSRLKVIYSFGKVLMEMGTRHPHL